MVNVTYRSTQTEILDEPHLPFEDVIQCMKELNSINTLLGGHAITKVAVKQFLKNNSNKPIQICEIGCGGGDNLAAIDSIKNKPTTTYIGIDLIEACTAFAASQYPQLPAKWIASDYSKVIFEKKPTLIFSSLFCHHFSDEHLVTMLQWMYHNSEQGFFINDLQRHPIAYHLIKWLTKIFSKSYMVKNDGPISVTRGFKRKEWEILFQKAGIQQYQIQWKWAFRYLIICKK